VPELSRKQKITAAALLVVIIFFSFFRDHLFRSINEQLRLNYYGENLYDYSFLAPYLSNLSDGALYRLKYILTAFFALFFTTLCILWVRNFFEKKKNYLLYVTITYASVFVLGALINGLGKAIHQEGICYSIARNILEFVQSPLLILILTAVFWYDSRLQKTE
jgi:hypothetical protein